MKKLIASAAIAAGSIGLIAAPADAQPRQQGLVNVYVEDLNVQVPVAVAANVCDVTVGVLVSELRDDASTCDAVANAQADNDNGESSDVRQEGLVNLALVDTNIQIPVGIAANICDVSAAVLVNDFRDAAYPCNSTADPVADN